LASTICDRSIVELAVAQQFHDRAWRSPAGNNRVTRWLNPGNVEDGREPIVGVQRAARNVKWCRADGCISLRGCECLYPRSHVRDTNEQYRTPCR
jgi:hypothetical protein